LKRRSLTIRLSGGALVVVASGQVPLHGSIPRSRPRSRRSLLFPALWRPNTKGHSTFVSRGWRVAEGRRQAGHWSRLPCPRLFLRRQHWEMEPGTEIAMEKREGGGLGSLTCDAYSQPCDPMSGNPNELDTSLLSDVAKSPGYSTIVQDAHTFPDIYRQILQEVMSVCRI